MSDKSVHVMVAAFHDEDAAKKAYEELKNADELRLISVDNAAVIRKDEKGKLHIKESHDMGGGKGAGIGSLVGGAVGLLAGGVGVLGAGAVGAAVGGLTAKLHDGGFKHEQLEAIGVSLQPGTSALVAVVEEDQLEAVHGDLAKDAKSVMVANLSPELAAQLIE